MKSKGLLAVVGASFLYGIMPIFSKICMREGMSSSSFVFNRFMMAAIFSFIILRVTKKDMRVSSKQLGELIVIGIIGYGFTAKLLATAYNLIPVGLATMFHFSNPLFITLVMIVLFKDKLTPFKAVSCVTAVIGLRLMADLSQLNALGIVLAILSGVTYGIYVIANKKTDLVNLDSFVIVFYVSTINTCFYAIQTGISGEFSFPPSFKSLVLVALIGLLCTVTSLALLTYGIRVLGASNAAMINLLEPIVSLVSGVIVYHDIISGKSWIGCVFVLASGILTALDSVKE